MTNNKHIIALLVFLLSALSLTAQPRYVAISSVAGANPAGQISSRYFNAVLAAGGVPVAVPQTADEESLKAVLSSCDGVILTGGEDINPAYYSEAPLPELGKVNDRRDSCDLAFFRAAMALGKPMLGICRGEQIINVFLGGSLYQDLPSQTGTAIAHRSDLSMKAHSITVDDSTSLGKVLLSDAHGSSALVVNSSHHQGLKRLASGLRIVAVADDGVVEAYESIPGSGHRIIAVQFHPEVFAPSGEEPFIGIFRYFLSTMEQ